MRARSPVALHLAALAAGALLGACGSGLYDAKGVPVVGGGDTCGTDQFSCRGTCTTPTATKCPNASGDACVDCNAEITAPANGVAACLGQGAAARCGYACTDAAGVSQGYLKCASGCCGATTVAAAERSTCALLSNGEVACWGANDSGQVGDGTAVTPRPEPHLVPLGVAATAVAAGGSHACAVVANGAVACWGANDAGQATGTASASPSLLPASTPVTSGAIAVAAGAEHTCALVSGGAVRCWGSNAAGQLGPGPGTPIASGATVVAAGRRHACALVAGQVQCWGASASGQLGVQPPSGGIDVPIASGIQHLAAGGDHTCAATGTSRVTSPDDALRCWGDSVGARWLLDEPQRTPAIPRKVVDRATVEDDVTLLVAGPRFACFMKKTEAVECLGTNDRGRLGNGVADGETALVPLPTAAAPTPVAVAIAVGAQHGCAALGDGRLRCWGANDAGQLGDGNSGDNADPGLGIPATPLGR